MKRVKYLFIIGTIFISSCKKSIFLEEKPADRFVIGNFYNSSSDAVSAVDAVYNKLYGIYDRNMILLGDLSTDNERDGIGMPNSNLQDLEYLRFTPENTFIQSMWAQNYSGISRANAAINNISKMSLIDDSLRSRLIAEASFLRALFYFNLVRFYGDVPLILGLQSVQDAYIRQSPKEEVYKQIIKDLEFAEDNLPLRYNNKDLGRVTKGAAIILLGKVYLTKHDFQKCVNTLSEVIEREGKYGYGLFDNFGDNFKLATQNGKETIFAVHYSVPPGHQNIKMRAEMPKYSIPGGRVPGISGNSWEADIPTMDLYSRYIDGDTRKDVTFKTEYVSPENSKTIKSSIPMFGKYFEETITNNGHCTINTPIIRYSDALLMYAEALNEIGKVSKAIPLLNRVRERAFHDPDHDYHGLTQSELRNEIYIERRLEFAGEGKRWFNLVRTGRFYETMKEHGKLEAQLTDESLKDAISSNVKKYQTLYPVPQRELDVNSKLTQNPGY